MNSTSTIESNRIEETDFTDDDSQVSEKEIMLQGANPLFLNCPFKREENIYGHRIIDFDQVKSGYNWIFDDEVVCSNYITGIHASVVSDEGVLSFLTRCGLVDSYMSIRITNAIMNSIEEKVISSIGIFTNHDDDFTETPGIIITSRGTYKEYFIPYKFLQKNYRRNQWHKGDKNSPMLEKWIFEDLIRFDRKHHFLGTPNDPISMFPRSDARIPDGLLLWHRGLGLWAKIPSSGFESFYASNYREFVQQTYIPISTLSYELGNDGMGVENISAKDLINLVNRDYDDLRQDCSKRLHLMNNVLES